MKLHINDLVLEVTRRCNMQCEHCLRGEAQCLDMSTDIVDKVIDMCDYIGHVTFTGGEPTLNLPLIRYFFEKAYEKFGYCPTFYLVTNGEENQLELANVLLWAYSHLDECEELDLCGVSLSVDDFHGHQASLPTHPIRALSFYSPVKEHKPGDANWVMARGRAEDNGLGHFRDIHDSWQIEPYGEDAVCIDGSEVYVSADGSVCCDCDLAYRDMEDYRVCMIDELPEFATSLLAPVGA